MTDGLVWELLQDEQPWRGEAACADADPSLFILEQGQSAAAGKGYCRVCPVTDECLSYGERTGSVGLWGGVVLTFKRSRVVDVVGTVQNARPVPSVSPPAAPPAVLAGPVADQRPYTTRGRKRIP